MLPLGYHWAVTNPRSEQQKGRQISGKWEGAGGRPQFWISSCLLLFRPHWDKTITMPSLEPSKRKRKIISLGPAGRGLRLEKGKHLYLPCPSDYTWFASPNKPSVIQNKCSPCWRCWAPGRSGADIAASWTGALSPEEALEGGQE